MNAIPTRYRNVQFRSRLEARWAAFFDQLEWGWDYEPIDLNGYIPDFILRFYKPLLVEVKPALTLEELAQHQAKIEESGWEHEALLVGANIVQATQWSSPRLGLLGEIMGMDDDGLVWDEAVVHTCVKCRRPSFHHCSGSFRCRVCGAGDGDHYLDKAPAGLQSMWNEAGNIVQWNRPA